MQLELPDRSAVGAAATQDSPQQHQPLRSRIEAALAAKNFERARTLAREALERAPRDPNCWNALGVALRASGHSSAAVIAYRRALDIDESQPGIWSNCGNALRDLQKFDEAIRCHERAIALDRRAASYAANLGVALRDGGRHREALRAYDQSIALDPNNALTRFDRAQVLLTLGDYRQGWREYEWRWRLPGMAPVRFARPRWDGSVQSEKTLLLWHEQGFGDTILAVRFAQYARQRVKRVIMLCQPELRRALGDVAGIDQLLVQDDVPPPFDLHCPLMSLPGFFLSEPDSAPPPAHIQVPEASRRKLQRTLDRAGRRLRVGIVWSGSVTFKSNHLRATTAERFLALGAIPGVQLFSLQKGPRASELGAIGADGLIIDLAPLLDDFADTAAAVDALDLVIMTDSAVAHLTGSLGKAIWNLLPAHLFWLYPHDRPQTPWYPAMRLFRQKTAGDWDSVFSDVAASLTDLSQRHARLSAGNGRT